MAERAFINILIAEDNEVSREMMAGLLRTQGYRTLGAIDGASAISMVRAAGFDCSGIVSSMERSPLITDPDEPTSRFNPYGSTGSDCSTASPSPGVVSVPVIDAVPTVAALNGHS